MGTVVLKIEATVLVRTNIAHFLKLVGVRERKTPQNDQYSSTVFAGIER
jgi:hypothetical protein